MMMRSLSATMVVLFVAAIAPGACGNSKAPATNDGGGGAAGSDGGGTDAGPLTGAALEARGFMIGHIVGKVSEGAPPVSGATVAPAAGTASKVDVVYPNATFTGIGTSTSATGI